MASHEVRRLVGLPTGQMRPRNADFGRVTPLEVGIRTTLSPTHTQVPAPAQNSACWLVLKPFVVVDLVSVVVGWHSVVVGWHSSANQLTHS